MESPGDQQQGQAQADQGDQAEAFFDFLLFEASVLQFVVLLQQGQVLVRFGPRMARLQIAELTARTRAEQQFALFRIAPQVAQGSFRIVLGQRNLLADRVSLDQLRPQQGLLEAGDRFINHAAGAQGFVPGLADLGQMQQRARDDFMLVEFAADGQCRFELLRGLVELPEPEQGPPGLEALEALVGPVAETKVDL